MGIVRAESSMMYNVEIEGRGFGIDRVCSGAWCVGVGVGVGEGGWV